MHKIKQEIRIHEEELQGLFAQLLPYSSTLDKWEDSIIYTMYDHNQFVVKGEISKEDIEEAIRYQKEHGKDFLKIDSRTPLAQDLITAFKLAEDITLTMLQKEKKSFKINESVVIKDVQVEDIEKDLLAVELQNYEETSGREFINLMISTYAKKARENHHFHFYGAYLNNKIEGLCYAYESNGYVVFDSLTVNEDARGQYIASTLIHHIMDTLDGKVYLHADKNDTPKEMYRKMGFEEIDELYEYVLQFDKAN